jgi:hypothetical protein
MEDEVERPKGAFNNLIATLKYLVTNSERIMRDDDEFTEFLCESVRQNHLKPTVAMYLYCSRYGIDEFKLVDLRMKNGGDRPPIAVFVDAILAGQDISRLLNAIDDERQARCP